MYRVHILGVPVDAVTMQEAVQRVLGMLRGGAQHHVMTPNSEMLVEASRNGAFKDVLQKSALNLPDSAGLLWAAWIKGELLPERVSGVDFVEKLCGSLSGDAPVFLLGGRNNAGKRTAEKFGIRNSGLRIAGMHEGSPKENDAQEIMRRVNASGAKLLLVAYGAPVQDLWIAKHLSQMPSVRVAIGVGGTFDFLAGSVRRAPPWMRSIGLEWLWRLMLQPWRMHRIFTAVVVFPILVFRYRR